MNVTSFGNRAFVDQIKVKRKSYWIQVTLNPVTGVLRRRGIFRHKHTVTEGGTSCDDRGKDWGHVPESQRTPCISGNHKKLGETHHVILPWSLLREPSPTDTLTSDF